MKKIFYSEKLNKNFDTEQECIKAEKAFDDAKATENEKKALLSKQKKELSDKVVDADRKVDEAYKAYEVAREKAAAIVEKARKEAEEILHDAARNVEKATEERMNHIQAFNKEFGPYMTSYVGDKAVEEYNKIIRRMRDIFGRHGFWLF